MFEYICDHVIPGCNHKDEDESREKLIERVEAHLSGYHGVDPHAEPIAESLQKTGVQFIRPA